MLLYVLHNGVLQEIVLEFLWYIIMLQDYFLLYMFIQLPEGKVQLVSGENLNSKHVLYFKDYHVICVYKVEDGEAVVYDLDSRLSFPCLFNEYVAKAIQPDELLKAEFHR